MVIVKGTKNDRRELIIIMWKFILCRNCVKYSLAHQSYERVSKRKDCSEETKNAN